jgi:hypothetical protein
VAVAGLLAQLAPYLIWNAFKKMVRFYKLILLKKLYLVYKMDAMEVYQIMHLNL